MLCKHEVTGSIPVSSTKSRSCFSIDAFCVNAMASIQKQARASEQVSTASGRDLKAQASRLKMFDNKMNWVTHLEWPLVRREAHKWRVSSECVKYKAEHMRVSASY